MHRRIDSLLLLLLLLLLLPLLLRMYPALRSRLSRTTASTPRFTHNYPAHSRVPLLVSRDALAPIPRHAS